MTTDAVVFEARDLDFVYRRRGTPVVALQGLTLSVARDEFVAIVGPSGCGKSTLLRLVAGLAEPTGGVLAGTSRESRADGRIGLMFQSPVLMPWRSVIGNLTVLEGLRRGGRDRAAVRERAEALLALVGLRDFADRLPGELSGGMQQRVALARALMLDPDVMLLDEPFGALDALTRETLNIELQRVWMERPTTVVLVTHDIQEAVLLADRVIVMSGRPGRIVADIAIPLPRPRRKESTYADDFQEISREVFARLDSASAAYAGVVAADRGAA